MNEDNFLKLSSEIAWGQHGGSGFHAFTRADMLKMPADHLRFYALEAGRRRKDEAERIRKAQNPNVHTINPFSGG